MSSANAGAVKASLAIAATELVTKVALGAYTAAQLEDIGVKKLQKQSEVHMAQVHWNSVHRALGEERRRASLVAARVDALKERLRFGHPAYELDIKTNTVLSIDDIKVKHVVDIYFETSERLRFTPNLEASAGFQPEKLSRSERDADNWWKGFATLDEDQLEALSKIPITIAMDERFAPYNQFDSEPATFPKVARLLNPTLEGFEPGDDKNHAILLEPACLPASEKKSSSRDRAAGSSRSAKSSEADQEAEPCPTGDVLVIDITEAAGFGCSAPNFRAPGIVTNGIGIPEEAVYIDHATGNIIPPFGPEDVLGMCLAVDFTSTPPSVDMLRDEQGRIVVVAWNGGNHPDPNFQYSNDFRSKTGDAVVDTKNRLEDALGGFTSGESFQAPPPINLPDLGGGPRFIGDPNLR